jgi:hypothetical protein
MTPCMHDSVRREKPGVLIDEVKLILVNEIINPLFLLNLYISRPGHPSKPQNQTYQRSKELSFPILNVQVSPLGLVFALYLLLSCMY